MATRARDVLGFQTFLEDATEPLIPYSKTGHCPPLQLRRLGKFEPVAPQPSVLLSLCKRQSAMRDLSVKGARRELRSYPFTRSALGIKESM
jgi:hypothetical protein